MSLLWFCSAYALGFFAGAFLTAHVFLDSAGRSDRGRADDARAQRTNP